MTGKVADNLINQFLEMTQHAQTTSEKNLTVAIAGAGGYIGRWFSVPIFSLGLSKFWVGLFGNSPPQLVSPLVESLKHTLTVSPELSFREKEIDYLNYEESVDDALHSKEKPLLPSFHSVKGVKNTVRSIKPEICISNSIAAINCFKISHYVAVFDFTIPGCLSLQTA